MLRSKKVKHLLLGLWVLWTYSAEPSPWMGFLMMPGWRSEWGGSREECLAALHRMPESVQATCVPAGILLRPLSVFVGHEQPSRWRSFAEFDIAPEFKEAE